MRFTCRLSKASAIGRGLNVHGDIEIDLDVSSLSTEQREALKELTWNDRHPFVGGNESIDLLDAINEYIEKEKQEAVQRDAEHAARVAKALAYDDDETFFNCVVDWRNRGELEDKYRGVPAIEIRFARVLKDRETARQAECDKAMGLPDREFINVVMRFVSDLSPKSHYDREDIRDRVKAIKAAREEANRVEQETAAAEDAARKERRKIQLATWVQERMTPLQQEKFAAGLMDEKEIIDNIRDDAFAPLATWPVYEPLTKDDVDDYDEYREIEFGKSNLDTVSDAQFESMKKARAALESEGRMILEMVPRRHGVGYKDEEKWTTTRDGLLIKLKINELSLSREFALD